MSPPSKPSAARRPQSPSVEEARARDLRTVLEILERLAQEHLDHHPLGHLVGQRKTALELSLRLPLAPQDGDLRAAVEHNEAVLKEELEALLAHRSVFQPGRVLCLRCSSTDCEHAAPADARQIFAGYGQSGLPRFEDFGQWLLERQHRRVDQLYSRPFRLITEVVSGEELTRELLPAFRDGQSGYQIHGQVVAGWFALPRPGNPLPLAVTFQVLSSSKRRRLRLGLNLLAAGPDGESLRELYDQLENPPWTSAVSWANSVLDSIERSQGRRKSKPEALRGRIEGLLGGIARRLEQRHRSRDRRTRHAERRHAEGDRPTRMAVQDLARAKDEEILADTRKNTWIVLGQRGRAHVFSPSGKLVTSIRYSPESISRKRQQEIWRPASAEEVIGLRKSVGVEEPADEGS